MLVYSERIKEERKNKDLSYEDMSKKLGYKSKSTYMYIEKGSTMPKLDVMIEISRILQKPISYFFNLEVQDNHIK